MPSPNTTSPGNNQGAPASTNKHAEVDDTDGFETSDTEDESDTEGDTSKEPNSVSKVPQYGGQAEIGAEKPQQMVKKNEGQYRGQNCTQFNPFGQRTCLKTKVTKVKYTKDESLMTRELFARKFVDPGCTFRPKDVISKFRDEHVTTSHTTKDIGLRHALCIRHLVIRESHLRCYRNSFTCWNNPTLEMQVIAINATSLKAKAKGVLLVALCKDGNEMVYQLAFGFAHSECTESWTWFLNQLQTLIQYPERVMLVSDQHAGIFVSMEAIFPNVVHGVCAYHLSQNLKRICKQRDDVIKLYYRATYMYRVKEFDREMAELKATHRKVYDELIQVGIEKFSRVHSPRKR
ncbi:hypothetical protein Dsin_032084 [Dipteronia sinensis]|uniref:MULE transposase domain-containing protein n=1 Tax=Dipteronia sinensis TaxID=43782 RepID=A0AAD9ZN55_9ROSI|nr:hypothetical protein Dsin_032084 [Dipteronia sinensis]